MQRINITPNEQGVTETEIDSNNDESITENQEENEEVIRRKGTTVLGE